MSKEENKGTAEIASIEDLLGDPSKKQSDQYIESLGKSVTIKRLTLGDLAKIASFNKSRGWEDDPYRTTIGILQRGVVKPTLQYSQAEEVGIDIAQEIVNHISNWSGLGTESVEQIRNLSEETTEST